MDSKTPKTKLTQNDALKLLVSSVELAQKRGAYNFDEAYLIRKAIKVFTQTPADQTPQAAPKSDVVVL